MQMFYPDPTPGNGLWTAHYTPEGKIYYYNMKLNQSKWVEEFQQIYYSYYTNYYVFMQNNV